MRSQLVAGVIAVFVVAGVVLSIVLLGPSFFAATSSASPAPDTTAQSSTVSGNAIVGENAQQGTYSWQIPAGKESVTEIQAYASSTYVLPGKSIQFYVSTREDGNAYSISIYRLGWYDGFGGRLMTSVDHLVGHIQGVYDPSTRVLQKCTSCTKDAQTGLIEAHWGPSYTLSVPSSWTTGIYLAKLTDFNGMQTYVPFDVSEIHSSSTYVAVTPDTTYAAYNTWGGISLYETDKTVNATTTTGEPGESSDTAKGAKVSFDRPYIQGTGSSQVLDFEVDAIRWMERQGYDLSYASDVNLHEVPDLLSHHKAYLSLAHDEYWTREMRDQVEHARDHGIGLAFLGADAAYWQMRFEPDSNGVPDRTVVCYKVQTDHGVSDLARDPLYGKDNTRVTALWRDPVLGRPENSLVGIMFSDLTSKRLGYPWRLDPAARSPLLGGTGLQPGQEYGCGLVGYEWDRVFNNGYTPPHLHIIATSPVRNDFNAPDTSNTSYYVASSGAVVFASGSTYWASALDNYRAQEDNICGYKNTVIPGIQALMAHIMEDLIVHHPGNS